MIRSRIIILAAALLVVTHRADPGLSPSCVDAIGNPTTLRIQLCWLIVSRPPQVPASITSYGAQAHSRWEPGLVRWKFSPHQRVTSGVGLLPRAL